MKPKIKDVFSKDDIYNRISPHWRPDGCWPIQGWKDKDGYGFLMYFEKGSQSPKRYRFRAHRAAYVLWHGAIPKGSQVLHRCDFPACVNPNHLFLGTQLDNMRDMIQKGRHGRTKLTKTQADKIRDIYSTGRYTQKQLADKFDVHISTIGHIIHKRSYNY